MGEPGVPAGQPKNSVMGIIALVLGIIGVIPCFWACGVFQIGAIVLGILGKKEVQESNGAKKGENLAQWGFILGCVGLALAVLYWILFATTDIFTFDFDSSF
jgi:hypothetical protein